MLCKGHVVRLEMCPVSLQFRNVNILNVLVVVILVLAFKPHGKLVMASKDNTPIS